jgi:hypothetical protein
MGNEDVKDDEARKSVNGSLKRRVSGRSKHRSSLRRLSGLRQGCHQGLEVLTAFFYMEMVYMQMKKRGTRPNRKDK